MRGFLQRNVGPLVEAVLRRFEASVSLEDHQRLVEKIEAEPEVVADVSRGVPPPAPSLDDGWQEDPEAIVRLAAWSAETAAALQAGGTDPASADAALASVTERFPARTWFLKRGVLFGTAALLRALVAVAGAPGAQTRDYTRDVCDRFLRHLEVRRDGWLPFRAAGRPADACEEIEKLAFTHALLDATETFQDFRYLNAALKAMDWHHLALSKGLSGASPEDVARVRRAYASGFRRQEALLGVCAGSGRPS